MSAVLNPAKDVINTLTDIPKSVLAQSTDTGSASQSSAQASSGSARNGNVDRTTTVTTVTKENIQTQPAAQTQQKTTATPSNSSILSTTASSASASSTSSKSVESSPSATITPSPSTTFATSTISSSSSSSSHVPASVSSVSSTPNGADAVPVVSRPEASSTHVPLAAIIAASVMGFVAVVAILFLIFRYCAPIRRKYDAWQEKKMLNRTYRGGLAGDDDIVVEKLSAKVNATSLPRSYTGDRFYGNGNPDHANRKTIVQSTGLGLGNRLSLLRQHSPFEHRDSNVRESQIGMAVFDPRHRELPNVPK